MVRFGPVLLSRTRINSRNRVEEPGSTPRKKSAFNRNNPGRVNEPHLPRYVGHYNVVAFTLYAHCEFVLMRNYLSPKLCDLHRLEAANVKWHRGSALERALGRKPYKQSF